MQHLTKQNVDHSDIIRYGPVILPYILISIIVWLFTEYDIARSSRVLYWNFSTLRATSYSVNSQATVFDGWTSYALENESV